MNILDRWVSEQFLDHDLEILCRFGEVTTEDVPFSVITAKNLLPASELIRVQVVASVTLAILRMNEHGPSLRIGARLIERTVGDKKHLLSWSGYPQAAAKRLPALRRAGWERTIAFVIGPGISDRFETLR